MDLGGEEALSEEQRCAVLEASCLLPFLESELSRASFADMSSRCGKKLAAQIGSAQRLIGTGTSASHLLVWPCAPPQRLSSALTSAGRG